MKATLTTTIAGLALSAVVFATESAKETGPYHAAKIVKIEAKPVKTPQFQAKGVENKDLELRQWLEIEAEVEIISNKTGAISKSLPELTANWTVLMKDKVTKRDKGVDLTVKLMGSSIYKNVRMEDGKLYFSAYIEPENLERYLGDGRIRESDFKLALTLHGEGIRVFGDEADTRDQWEGKYLDEGIVAKSKTPFALINIDRYPPEKAVQ